MLRILMLSMLAFACAPHGDPVREPTRGGDGPRIGGIGPAGGNGDKPDREATGAIGGTVGGEPIGGGPVTGGQIGAID